MHTGWPAALSSAALLVAWPVVVLRALYFDRTRADRQLAAIIGLGLVNCTLREPNCQRLITVASGGHLSVLLMYQLSVVAFAASSAAGVLFARDGRDRPVPGIALAVTTGLWVLSAVVLGLAEDPDALVRGDSAESTALVYFGGAVPLALLVGIEFVALGRAGLSTGGDRIETALHLMVIGVGIVSVVQAVSRTVTAVLLGTGHSTALTRLQGLVDNDLIFPTVLAGTVFYAAPLIRSGLERVRLDGWSRRGKQLLPLWSELTAACPEIVHRAPGIDRADSRYRVYRTVVEIRDCMLILSRHTRALPPEVRAAIAARGMPEPERRTLESAVALVFALRARSSGRPTVAAVGRVASVATDMDSEIDELARMAAVWPLACGIAARGA